VIIAISALSNQKSITNVLMVGADDYIIKPFSTGLFMARISANVRQTLFLKEISKKNQELALQAISDGLTGLYNHNHTYLRLEEEIAKAIRYQRPLSVIMLDIDRFKQINDSYGHPAGDQVLIQVSAIIKKSLRKSDIGGRYGGEEFLIILPETREKEANILANRIREKVKEIHMGDQSQCLSLSGGVYAWQGEDALKLVAEADRLLYRAKEMGRDRIEMKS
jgi:two-component system cell cycle response regulator